MKLFVVAYAAYAVSWFLPVLETEKVGLEFVLKNPVPEFAPALAWLQPDPADPAIHDTYGSPRSLRGYDAARTVWEMLRKAAGEEPRNGRRILDLVWSNLANPLFVLAALLLLLGRIRLATLAITVGTFSAARWLLDGNLDPAALRSGYWCWLGSFVVAAAGLWTTSARSILGTRGGGSRRPGRSGAGTLPA